MKRFLLKLFILSIFFGCIYLYLVDRTSRQYVDPYYPKFTQEAGSLILGISRAGEGINPTVLEETLSSSEIELPIINFALFKYQSPYGQVYLDGIKQKLGTMNKPGIFVLSVTPGNFSVPKNLSEESILELDRKMMIGRLSNFTSYPNYNYIFECYEPPLYNALFPVVSENQIPHPNGWNELILETPSFKISKEKMNHYKSLVMREYHKIEKEEEISKYRIDSFKLIIDYLKGKGEVFVVILPADPEIMALEERLWPNIKAVVNEIANEKGVIMLDYSEQKNQYIYYDGSHMESESANRFSHVLGQDIKKHLNVNTY